MTSMLGALVDTSPMSTPDQMVRGFPVNTHGYICPLLRILHLSRVSVTATANRISLAACLYPGNTAAIRSDNTCRQRLHLLRAEHLANASVPQSL